jgi:hypothetical protein
VTATLPGWVAADASHLDVALATSAGGWPVFPCRPEDKRPATQHGFLDATTEPERLRRWWTAHPAHLLAVPTEGLLVVDLDWRPPAPCPWAWWQALCEAHGWDWASNLLVETPSGGVHVYFADPLLERNLTGLAASLAGYSRNDPAARVVVPQVDVRATGGYVIAAGSRLPDGRTYSVLEPVPVIPAAPGWLRVLLARAHQGPAPARSSTAPAPASRAPARGDQRGSRYGVAAMDAELEALAGTPQGRRNDALNEAAFALWQLVYGGHLDGPTAGDALLDAALRLGLGHSEAVATIKSGRKAAQTKPRRAA